LRWQGKINAKINACQNDLTDKTKKMCLEKTAQDPKEGADGRWRAVNEMDKVLDCLEGRLDRITAVIRNTSAQERLLIRGAAAEVSSRESTEDPLGNSDVPVLQSSTGRHRIVDVEPTEARVSKTPEARSAWWRTEVYRSAAPLTARTSREGAGAEALGEKEKSAVFIRQQAEDRFDQTIGLEYGCRQSIALLHGPGKGPATKINGLFH
jgi:hypothetical protein